MKKITILLVAVMVLTLSACGLMDKAKQSVNQAKEKTQKEAAKYSDKNPFTGGLKAAIALGTPMKCTYKDEDGNQMLSYIKNKKYAGEFNEGDEKGYMVMADDCMWIWGEEMEGVKMCYDMEKMEELGEQAQNEAEEMGDMWDQLESKNPGAEYKCVPAMVGDDKFQIPSDVQFMDMSEMMNGMMEGMGNMMENMDEEDWQELDQMGKDMENNQEMNMEQVQKMMEKMGGEQ